MQHFRPFFNVDDCQPEVVSDVISGMIHQDVGGDVRANFGDSRLPHFVRTTTTMRLEYNHCSENDAPAANEASHFRNA